VKESIDSLASFFDKNLPMENVHKNSKPVIPFHNRNTGTKGFRVTTGVFPVYVIEMQPAKPVRLPGCFSWKEILKKTLYPGGYGIVEKALVTGLSGGHRREDCSFGSH
jgi:hypothetical protein